jgi:dTDP-4-dehydrorhamnose 3,5-epimerase
MDIRPFGIEGAFEVVPRQFADPRGTFLEYYRADALAEAVGHPLHLRQANCSVSAAGTLRGVHFADVPPSQAKYVTCMAGSALDVVVDLRTGSPTFGQWEAVLLDDVDRRGVYIAEGLGHAFQSLQDGTVVAYLCSETYAPQREHGVHPLDADLAIGWPTRARDGSPLEPRLSDKDAAAPTLRQAQDAGLLPSYETCRAYTQELSDRYAGR